MKTLSVKEKWIYLSSAIALFSMFLPWSVWGMRSDNGWEFNYYIALAFWVIPIISAHNNTNWKVINKISILLGSSAFVVFIGERGSITILGDTYASNVGAGAYIYLLSWSAAVYSEFMVPHDTFNANGISGDARATSTNEQLYLQVDRDFENNLIDEALWIKSLTICDGDKDKAKFKYIRDQVSRLEQEMIINNEIKETASRNTLVEFKNKISLFYKLYKSEEFKNKSLATDQVATITDETLTKSKYSFVLGVLSILGAVNLLSSSDNNVSDGVIVVISLGVLTASIGGIVLGMANIKNKQEISKLLSIFGIAMSGLVLTILLWGIAAAVFS